MTSDFYQYPELYDALLPVGAHVPFYLDLARNGSGDVLELAVGTGQLAVPIAAAGFPTCGLDLSEATSRFLSAVYFRRNFRCVWRQAASGW